jgi:hypothetical protein
MQKVDVAEKLALFGDHFRPRIAKTVETLERI